MQNFALIFVTEQSKTNPAKTGANGEWYLEVKRLQNILPLWIDFHSHPCNETSPNSPKRVTFLNT